MVHSLNLDEALLQNLLAISGHTNLEAAIDAAVRDYIQRHQRQQILNLFGTIDYDDTYSYKAQRQIP